MTRQVMLKDVVQMLKNIENVLSYYQGSNAVLNEMLSAVSDFNKYFAPGDTNASVGLMAQGYPTIAKWPPVAGRTC